MYTWLSRVMAVVFLLNTLFPSYAALPAFRVDRQQVLENKVRAATAKVEQTEQNLSKRFVQYLEDIGRVRTRFEEAPTYEMMQSAYQEMDKLRRQAAWEMGEYQKRYRAAAREMLNAENEQFYDYYRQNPHVAPDAISQTLGYDARYKYSPVQLIKMEQRYSGSTDIGCPTSQQFLNDVKTGAFETGLDKLLEYIDPLGGVNCHDYLAIAYAAEMLYGIAQEHARNPDSLPQEQREEIKSFYAQAQVRAYEALQRLNKIKTMDNSDLYAARGTLRILLMLLQQAVSANGLELNEPELYFVYPSKALYNKIYPAQNKSKSYKDFREWPSVSIPALKPTYEAFVAQDAYFFSSLPADLPKGYKTEKVSLSSLDAHPLAKKVAQNYFSLQSLPKGAVLFPMAALDGYHRFFPLPDDDILSEFNALKKKNPEADSKEFVSLSSAIQYATLYALFAGDESLLSEMVALFEGAPKGNFKTQYSDVLGAVFDTLYETLKQFALNSVQINTAFDFLRQMAEPTHATGTRVLALHTLGMLTEPLMGNVADDASLPQFLKKQDPLDMSAQFRSAVSDNNGVVNNRYWLSYADRAKFARYTADLYAPLQGVSNYTLDDYGLSSDEMVKLSNLLASTYVEFLPVMGPSVTRDECMNVAKMDTQHLTPITPESLAIASAGYVLPAGCERRTKEGTFVFTSKGTVEMLLVNRTNWRKVEKENAARAADLFGEALFWVYGGVLISGSLRALRLLSGVVKSLPRAIKAGKIVYKSSQGTRMVRLAAALRRGEASVASGTRYMSQANFTANLSKNGMGYMVEENAAAQATKGSRVTANVTSNPAAVATTGNTTTSLVRGFRTPRFMPKNKITLFAADETSGMYRMGTFPVNTERLAQMPLPLQRAELMRFAQWQGLRNWWTGADRSLFNINNMFQNYWLGIGKNASHIPVPGEILTYHPVVQAVGQEYWSMLKWFAGFKALDVSTATLFSYRFNHWAEGRQKELLEKEMSKYGDLFDEKNLNQGTALVSPSAALGPVGAETEEKFTWGDVLALPSWLWRKVSPTRADATEGALISYPFTVMHEILTDQSLFMPESTQEQIRINANRLALSKAQQEGAMARTEDILQKSTDALLQVMEQNRTEVRDFFSQVRQTYGFKLNDEERGCEAFFDRYVALVESTWKMTDWEERAKRLESLSDEYQREWQDLVEKINAKVEAYVAEAQALGISLPLPEEPKTEEAYLASVTNYLTQVLEAESDEIMHYSSMRDNPTETTKYLYDLGDLVKEYQSKAQEIADKNISFEEKKMEWNQLVNTFDVEAEELFQALQRQVLTTDGGYSVSEYPEMYDAKE
ncbi:MAG: hypothetical protein MR039_02875 [Elusimicrobia bacterium]|nr:hypothetical protein [Elusimicrobiota bacterium]